MRAGQVGKNQNFTISNLEILDLDFSIGFIEDTSDCFDGLTIDNNHIRMATDLNGVVAPGDGNQNIGILLGSGNNQHVTNNVIDIPGDGVSDPVASSCVDWNDPSKCWKKFP